MDNYTIRGLRDEAAAAGRPPKPLVSLRPQDSLHAVIFKLFRSRCSMAPVLSAGEGAPLGQPRSAPQAYSAIACSAAHVCGAQSFKRACCCKMWSHGQSCCWPLSACLGGEHHCG